MVVHLVYKIQTWLIQCISAIRVSQASKCYYKSTIKCHGEEFWKTVNSWQSYTQEHGCSLIVTNGMWLGLTNWGSCSTCTATDIKSVSPIIEDMIEKQMIYICTDILILLSLIFLHHIFGSQWICNAYIDITVNV